MSNLLCLLDVRRWHFDNVRYSCGFGQKTSTKMVADMSCKSCEKVARDCICYDEVI